MLEKTCPVCDGPVKPITPTITKHDYVKYQEVPEVECLNCKKKFVEVELIPVESSSLIEE